MSYIGNTPFTAAFLTDTFSGDGSDTTFTLSAAPANTSSIIVAVSGVLQDPSTYSVSGTTLTFSAAPPSGTDNISVRFLGIPASGVTTTAYRTVTEFTATAGQTSFSVPSYTVGYVDVYRNGVMLGTADFTATSGTTVVLASGATAGDLIRVESFYVSSVLNAIPATAGAVTNSYLGALSTITTPSGVLTVPDTTATLLTSASSLSSVPGAIREVDQWRISTVNTYSGTGWSFLTTNWERADTHGFNKLGTGMSESSGVFTFPSTGLYLINFQLSTYNSSTNVLYFGPGIWVTTNNSTYNGASVGYNHIYIVGADTSAGATISYVFNVTDTANCKCKFGVDKGTSATYNINGDTSATVTGVNFIRLGDSV